MNIEKHIKDRLNVLEPKYINLKNESFKHKNHKNKFDSEQSETHFKLSIVSHHFENLSLIQIHRMIFNLIKDLINNPVHSISINAKAN